MSDDEMVEIEVDRVEVETERAIMFSDEGDEYWIPKSQIGEGSEVTGLGDKGTLVIPEWLAREKGLI